MKRTGGTWSKDEARVYFIASNIDTLQLTADVHDYLLIAVNEIRSDEDIRKVEALIDAGKHVLIDSGVFWLTNRHAEKHGLSMDQALALAPTEIDNFDSLFEAYCTTIARIGSRSWGYIEIDQGGMANKKKTRKKLEKMGFEPMPVYHPLNDGPEYFDELAKGYARMCHGNVVMAAPQERKRLLATLWERRQKYPSLWVHFLGLTPNEWCLPYPPDSADSSAWIRLFKWSPTFVSRSMLRTFGDLDGHWTYDMGVSTDLRPKAVQLAAFDAAMTQRVWKNAAADIDRTIGPFPTRQVIAK